MTQRSSVGYVMSDPQHITLAASLHCYLLFYTVIHGESQYSGNAIHTEELVPFGVDIFVKTLQLTNILNVVICLDQNKIIQKEQ